MPNASIIPDHCAMALETLARAEADLRAQVRDLERDTDAYRLLALMAVHELAELTGQCDRQRDELQRLRAENTWLRAEVMRASAAKVA